MRTRPTHGRNKLVQVMIAAALGLAMAGGDAAAQSDGGLHGTQNRLAALLENISSVPHQNWPNAAEAFIFAAADADMTDMIAVTIPALNDSRVEQRYYALVGMGAAAMASVENGEGLTEEAPALVASLSDDDAWVREAAVAALAATQPAPPDWTVGAIIGLTGDPEPRVAVAAMQALERVAVGHAEAGAIYSMFHADDAPARSRAVKVLATYYGAQGNYREAEWTLIQGLHDPGTGVRWQAATALGNLDEAQWAFAVWHLHYVSRDPAEDPMVRRAATTAINNILN